MTFTAVILSTISNKIFIIGQYILTPSSDTEPAYNPTDTHCNHWQNKLHISTISNTDYDALILTGILRGKVLLEGKKKKKKVLCAKGEEQLRRGLVNHSKAVNISTRSDSLLGGSDNEPYSLVCSHCSH